MNSHQLGELLQLLAIAHHIPGRIRLKLVSVQQAQARGLDLTDVERFTTALRQVAGVRSVTLNAVALSCVIDYNPDALSHDTWAALLSGVVDHGAAMAVLQQLDACLAVDSGSSI